MIEKIREIKRTLDMSISVGERADNDLRNTVITGVFLIVLGIVISAINVVHGAYNIAVYPAIFIIGGILDLIFAIKYKSRLALRAIIIPIATISLTAMMLFSDNGFAYLWTMLIPISYCYLFSVKVGFIITAYFQIFLIILFYTPARKLVESHYSEIAMSRYPLLFFFNGAIVLISMYSYHKSVLFEIKHAEEARELSEAKTGFLASMSHEIRTPINAILGMNEMILRENRDPVIEEYAESVKNSGQMLLMLVNDVLDFSKIEAGKMEIHDSEFIMAYLLHNIMPMLQERAGEKSLMLDIRLEDEVPNGIVSDEFRIRQVLINLLNNAIKYTDSGWVELILGGEYIGDDKFNLIMSVKDTGRGISEEAQNHLFEAFSRADLKENRSIEGTGLGLAIVKRILDSMCGQIAVSSKRGEGSEFTVQIPVGVFDRTPLEEDYEKQVEAVVAESVENDYTAPEASVLAVDDNSANLRIVSLFLKRVGIAPELCKSGTGAIDLCKNKKYDLLLLDHRMPDPDGIKTLEVIRSDPDSKNKETPAVVLTANALAGSDKIYSDAGFAGYLTKPLDASLLEQTVKKYLPADKILPVGKGDDPSDVIVFTANSASFEQEPDLDSLRDKLKKIDGLDYETALKYAGGHEDLLKDTVGIIASESEEKIERMRNCILSEDWEGYELVTHSIKGLMASLGLNDLSERAKKHENAATGRDIDFIRSDSESFIEAYRDVCMRLK
ncbi:MAG: response regulator [Lachnospiraceae bacterium]|nr:response regulator [Lachnospiraceae bacterium]